MATLEIKNLSFTYNGAKEKALDNITFTIKSGDFVLLCGETGCGKSTLLRLIKKQLMPKGKKEGEILYCGKNIEDLSDEVAVSDIGYVMQNPENQIVTDKVWHELAFGLESLGKEQGEIRRKVAEICGFFGIGDWYLKKTCELSGGQKQLLNLASVMVMNPKVLVLDEPTSQLDPISASDFIRIIKKINDELGVTIIIAEHRLEEVFSLASKVVVMDKASILMVDTPKNVGKNLLRKNKNHKIAEGLPSAVRIYNELIDGDDCPLTVREGKDFIENHYRNTYNNYIVKDEDYSQKEVAIEVKNGFFRYERNLPDVIKGLSLKVYENEILSISGANGSGKTTLIKILSGLKNLYHGNVKIWGKNIKEYKNGSLYRNNIACLPQNPQLLFCKSKVIDDLREVVRVMEYSKEDGKKHIYEIVEKLGIENLLFSHPYDLSGGEQQKVAFAKILLMNPRIILLDEPTKGIDPWSKKMLADILYELKAMGKTIVIVTHDIEFSAQHSDRCAMFFDGQIVSTDNPVNFFSTNNFYTTNSSRISRGLFKNAVTVDMVVELCKKNGGKDE